MQHSTIDISSLAATDLDSGAKQRCYSREASRYSTQKVREMGSSGCTMLKDCGAKYGEYLPPLAWVFWLSIIWNNLVDLSRTLYLAMVYLPVQESYLAIGTSSD